MTHFCHSRSYFLSYGDLTLVGAHTHLCAHTHNLRYMEIPDINTGYSYSTYVWRESEIEQLIQLPCPCIGEVPSVKLILINASLSQFCTYDFVPKFPPMMS